MRVSWKSLYGRRLSKIATQGHGTKRSLIVVEVSWGQRKRKPKGHVMSNGRSRLKPSRISLVGRAWYTTIREELQTTRQNETNYGLSKVALKRVSNWINQSISGMNGLMGSPFRNGDTIANHIASEWPLVLCQTHITVVATDLCQRFTTLSTYQQTASYLKTTTSYLWSILC